MADGLSPIELALLADATPDTVIARPSLAEVADGLVLKRLLELVGASRFGGGRMAYKYRITNAGRARLMSHDRNSRPEQATQSLVGRA